MLTLSPSSTLCRELAGKATSAATEALFADDVMERVRNLSAQLQLVLIAASSEPADRWVDRIEPFFNANLGVHLSRALSLAELWDPST